MKEQNELLRKEDFFISTDKRFLDVEVIHNFLCNESYWLKGATMEMVVASIENSTICYGIYDGDPRTGSAKQIGFARVITDFVRFSWLGDVFILPEYRGHGLSKWLMSIITEHPKLKGTNFNLATKDAHSLYAQYGFKPLENVEKRMARPLDWGAIHEGLRLEN